MGEVLPIHPYKLAKPHSDSDWELWCKKIFAKQFSLADLPRFEPNGRPQNGIDLLAKDDEGRTIGVQCKLRNAKKPPTPAEMDADLKAFKKLCDPPRTFIVATTHESTSGHRWAQKVSSTECQVQYYAWTNIEDIVRTDKELLSQLCGIGPSQPSESQRLFSRRAAEFSRAADQHRLIAKVWLYGDPDVHPHDDDFHQEMRADGPSGRGTSWSADWRNFDRSGVGMPPFWYGEDNKRVTFPESKYPKPWAWFDPDNPNGESGLLWLLGSASAAMRYSELAGAAWKEAVSSRTEMSREKRDLIERQAILQRGVQKEDGLWTMFLFQVAWSGKGPASLAARRFMWIPGYPGVEMEAGMPDPEYWARSVPPFAGRTDIVMPKSWKHFRATLEPSLFTASADVAEWLAS